MHMVKRGLWSLLVVSIVASFGFAQTPLMPPPDMLPGDAGPEQVRAEVLAVHDIICGDIDHAAQILMATGTLGEAIPYVVEITGLTHAEVDALEREVCKSDLSTLSFEEVRFKNRQAVWLLDVHMAALKQVLTAQ